MSHFNIDNLIYLCPINSLGPLLLLRVLLGEPVEHVGEGLLLLGGHTYMTSAKFSDF